MGQEGREGRLVTSGDFNSLLITADVDVSVRLDRRDAHL